MRATVTRFSMASNDHMVITSRSQPFLQFLAEIGGMMAFFLGMSFISVVECCCFGAIKAKRKIDER